MRDRGSSIRMMAARSKPNYRLVISINIFVPLKFHTLYVKYRTRAIIARSRFETALDYKPRIFRLRKVSM